MLFSLCILHISAELWVFFLTSFSIIILSFVCFLSKGVLDWNFEWNLIVVLNFEYRSGQDVFPESWCQSVGAKVFFFTFP